MRNEKFDDIRAIVTLVLLVMSLVLVGRSSSGQNRKNQDVVTSVLGGAKALAAPSYWTRTGEETYHIREEMGEDPHLYIFTPAGAKDNSRDIRIPNEWLIKNGGLISRHLEPGIRIKFYLKLNAREIAESRYSDVLDLVRVEPAK